MPDPNQPSPQQQQQQRSVYARSSTKPSFLEAHPRHTKRIIRGGGSFAELERTWVLRALLHRVQHRAATRADVALSARQGTD